MKLSIQKSFLIFATSFVLCGSAPAISSITYFFTGSLTSVSETGAGQVNAFGTTPLGTQVNGSLTFYQQGSGFSGTATYLYTTLGLGIGADLLKKGPTTNYAPGYVGSAGPGGDASANFTITDGSVDRLELANIVTGTVGGQSVSTYSTDPIVIGLNFTGNTFSAADPFGLNLLPTNFLSGSIQIPETGWGTSFFSNAPGFQRGTITINSFSAIPEPSMFAALGVGGIGFAFSRRRL